MNVDYNITTKLLKYKYRKLLNNKIIKIEIKKSW